MTTKLSSELNLTIDDVYIDDNLGELLAKIDTDTGDIRLILARDIDNEKVFVSLNKSQSVLFGGFLTLASHCTDD